MGRYDWNSDPDEIGMSGGLFGRLFPEAYAEAESLGDAPSQPSAGDGGIASPFSPSIPAAFGVWPSASPFTQLGQGPVPPVYSPPASDPPAPVLTAKVQANQPAPVDADGGSGRLSIGNPGAGDSDTANATVAAPPYGFRNGGAI